MFVHKNVWNVCARLHGVEDADDYEPPNELK